MSRRAALGAVACAVTLALAGSARADWTPVPLPPPPGGQFSVPAGVPGDLSFWAPNRGLMTVGGNNAVPEGIYSWDGVEWHQLAVVCGAGEQARIAWAGPREFWTIAKPSLPRPQLPGLALCHFKDGEVVAAYSTAESSADRYHAMGAAACAGPDNCWFGGVRGQDASGQRVGAFHLHWDGRALRTVYNSSGGPASDLAVVGGEFHESASTGPGEAPTRLLTRISGGVFVDDPFTPAAVTGVPDDATALLALDAADGEAWAVGGGRTVQRAPLVARFDGATWRELTLTGGALTSGHVLTDVAVVPGTGTARAVVQSAAETVASGTPRVATIAADGSAQLETITVPGGAIRGAAVRVACPAANDCWLATGRGYLFRDSSAGAYERDTDPAFQGTITTRPNEAAEQAIPDVPPEDDSRLHAPPIELPPPPPPPDDSNCDPRPSAVWGVKRPIVRGRTQMVVSFRLRRRARVGIVAHRGGRVVARAKVRTLRAGRRTLTLRVSPRRWPKRLEFVVKEGKAPACTPSTSGDDVVASSGPAGQ